MADTKISGLPGSTTPLAGTEVLPIVQSSSTVQVSVANLTAGRAVATGALTVTGAISATGTLSGGTSGTGYSFSGSAPATSLTLDASGNLGLGVTPSAWANSRTKIQFSSAGTIAGFVGCFDGSGSTNQMGLGSNCFYNASSNWIYNNTGPAGKYEILNNVHAWHNAASGTAGNVISFTQAMTLDSSGNVGIGTTTPRAKFEVNGVGSFADGSAATPTITFGNELTVGLFRAGNAILGFSTGSTERMRIDSSGIVTMNAYGAGAATFSSAGVISSVSDETWKVKDGVPVDTDAMLQKLEPCYWFYNEEKAPIFGQERQLGFFAQNVNAAIGPEAAPEPEEGKPWGYYDRSVLAVTVMSLQKALATIDLLTARITALETT